MRKFSGELLRQKRLDAGLLPESAALAISRSCYSIHEYEMGRRVPPVPTLAEFADLYGCPLDDLFEQVAINA